MTVIREWLRSRQFVSIEGIDLMPVSVEEWPDTPLVLKSSRAEVCYLKDSNDRFWVIKRFLTNGAAETQNRHSIKSLIPHRPGFEAGYLRKVLNQASVSNQSLWDSRLPEWIENAVLMPAVSGFRWAELASNIREGRQSLPRKHRIRLVRNLCERIGWLESQDISHRNLSSTNIHVDLRGADVYLVDWDNMFHPTLVEPDHLSRGTVGYIAPFVPVRGTSSGHNTWRACSDRFSLTLLIAEILTLNADWPVDADGGFWDQDEIYNRDGPSLTTIIRGLKARSPKVSDLFQRALEATGFECCPAPADWILATGVEIPIKARPIPVRDRAEFVRLNRAGFTTLRRSRFASLKHQAFVKPPHRLNPHEFKTHRRSI